MSYTTLIDVITVFFYQLFCSIMVFFFKLFVFCSYFCIRIVMAYRKSLRYCCLMKIQESLFSPTFYKSLFYSSLYIGGYTQYIRPQWVDTDATSIPYCMYKFQTRVPQFPGPLVCASHWGLFKFLWKFVEIFATLWLTPMSMTQAIRCSLLSKTCLVPDCHWYLDTSN